MSFVRKKMVSLGLVLLMSFGLFSCYGSFSLTRRIYNWNGTLGNKYVNTVVFWALLIVPVYEITGVVDFWVLNTLEFWTGTNPMAMKKGETETQIVEKDGKIYRMVASKDRMDITVSEKEGNTVRKFTLLYDRETNTWNKVENGETIVLARMSEDGKMFALANEKI